MTRFSNQFNCSEVYDLARQILNETACGRSLAMKNAWLVYKLDKGVVKFKYKKENGEIREAIGTLNTDFMSDPSVTYRHRCAGVQRYYDLEKFEWRSYKMINVL